MNVYNFTYQTDAEITDQDTGLAFTDETNIMQIQIKQLDSRLYTIVQCS